MSRRRVWIALPFAAAVVLILFRLQPRHGALGHDYYHALVRLLIGASHFWKNGWAIPHYTPSLCGGIPFFADPQSTYFSLTQFLTFFIDPLLASYITIGVSYIIGYIGFLKLTRELFGCGTRLAHLAGLAFSLNGFSFAHLYVGHLTHHGYLLFPLMLYFLMRSLVCREIVLRSVIGLSLCLIYLFYSGGFHMLVVFSVLGGLVFPYLIYARGRDAELGRLAGLIFGTILLLALTCSGKLVASFLFSKHFVKSPIDRSDLGVFEMVVQYFWPVPQRIPLYIRFGSSPFGPWEFVGFASKLLFPFVVLGALLCLPRMNRAKCLLVLTYLILVPYVCLIAVGRGGNEFLPFWNVYHNPLKIFGGFLPLFVLLAIYALHSIALRVPFSGERPRTIMYFIFSACLIFEFNQYSRAFLTNPIALGHHYDPSAYRDLKKSGGIARVDQVITGQFADLTGLNRGCSSLKCYEPLFGYRSERVHSQLSNGATSQIVDGKFNSNHPGCFLYPKFFGCGPWERISANDRENFDLFIHGKSEAWGVPLWQSLILYGNGLFILLLVALALRPQLRLPVFWRPVFKRATVEV